MFVPAHAEATEDIAPLAQANIDKVHEIAEKILCVCKEALCFEDILQRLFNDFSLSMNFEQYVLIGSTVRSYLPGLRILDGWTWLLFMGNCCGSELRKESCRSINMEIKKSAGIIAGGFSIYRF